VVHDFTFAAGTDGFVLTVPLQSLPDLLSAGAATGTALARAGHVAADDCFAALFAQLYDEHAAAAPGRGLMLRALAAQLACRMLRRLADATPAADGHDPRLVRFAAQIRDHLRDGWRLADHARALGLSERHLSRLCRAAYGQPASALIAEVTMREACRMLAYTRASVAEIGYGLGFEDPSYFSRAFRRVMGRSPAAYRAGLDAG
jgi:AraC family transcriptional activator of pobA